MFTLAPRHCISHIPEPPGPSAKTGSSLLSTEALSDLKGSRMVSLKRTPPGNLLEMEIWEPCAISLNRKLWGGDTALCNLLGSGIILTHAQI